jgi:periplasmic protein TonB
MNDEHVQMMKLMEKQQRASYLVSFLLHGLVILTFYYVRVTWQIAVPQLIEIQFESGQEQQSSAESAPLQTVTESVQPEQLDLAERRMMESEPETIPINKDAKIVPNEQMHVIQRDIVSANEVAPINRDLNRGEKQMANFDTNSKLSPDFENRIGDTSIESPFKIEGQAALRSILVKQLPNYPENLQQEAVVRIRFTVLPNGLIGEMIPVLKGSDILEKITMEAFKQWRFNPLPPNVPQVTEQGFITFRYILK